MNKTFAQCDGCKAINTGNDKKWVAIDTRNALQNDVQLHFCPACADKTKISGIASIIDPPKPAQEAPAVPK